MCHNSEALRSKHFSVQPYPANPETTVEEQQPKINRHSHNLRADISETPLQDAGKPGRAN
jgi:hypothetical protein